MCHGSLYAVMWLADEPREFNLPTLPQRCITKEAEKLPSKYGVHSEDLVKLKMPPAHIQAYVQLIGALLLYELQNILEKKEKRTWVKKWIRTRIMHGASNTVLKELAEENPAEYRKDLRMSPVLRAPLISCASSWRAGETKNDA
ncbi:hypothetical protein ANN_13347 [Periplaneta americana]|uniref:Uncharacterized protein n=1 Tax=Periplaneta americana TaxID=6978 RepID=A0ABQ8TJB9_PERAM|nr:hypothetical protein ANN_13347 [Periplaneta americana]